MLNRGFLSDWGYFKGIKKGANRLLFSIVGLTIIYGVVDNVVVLNELMD